MQDLAVRQRLQPDVLKKMEEKIRSVVGNHCRLKHYSYKTEQTYSQWIIRFWRFNSYVKLGTLGAKDIEKYLTWLAVERRISASTQNQAFNAIVTFLYRVVIPKDLGDISAQRAHTKTRVPVVFTKEEVMRVLKILPDTEWLIASLLYGSGLRISECLRLRVKDVDFERRAITVKGGKGDKDRNVPLPERVIEPLKRHLLKVEDLHKRDALNKLAVSRLEGLERKYPAIRFEWGWYWVFPARKKAIDPRDKIEKRHHLHNTVVQRNIKSAIKKGGDYKACELSYIPPFFCNSLIRKWRGHTDDSNASRS